VRDEKIDGKTRGAKSISDRQKKFVSSFLLSHEIRAAAQQCTAQRTSTCSARVKGIITNTITRTGSCSLSSSTRRARQALCSFCRDQLLIVAISTCSFLSRSLIIRLLPPNVFFRRVFSADLLGLRRARNARAGLLSLFLGPLCP